MLKRTIVVSSPSRLSLKDNQLISVDLNNDENIKTAPIEDLGIVLIENPQVQVSIPLLNALSNNNVSVVFCNSQYLPNSILVSLDANSTQGETLRYQMNAKPSLNNHLWKQIIESKIRNQARLLEKLGKDASLLYPLFSHVKSGDSDNREGIAARVYWKELFGKDFVRDRDGLAPNNMLNYGYSILRSATARALVGSGLSLSIGIFHKNRYNPMPLADDIMEAFRPFIDEIVFWLYSNGEKELTREVKNHLISVLTSDTTFSDFRRPLQIGLSITTASIAKCYSNNEQKLSLPKLE